MPWATSMGIVFPLSLPPCFEGLILNFRTVSALVQHFCSQRIRGQTGDSSSTFYQQYQEPRNTAKQSQKPDNAMHKRNLKLVFVFFQSCTQPLHKSIHNQSRTYTQTYFLFQTTGVLKLHVHNLRALPRTHLDWGRQMTDESSSTAAIPSPYPSSSRVFVQHSWKPSSPWYYGQEMKASNRCQRSKIM